MHSCKEVTSIFSQICIFSESQEEQLSLQKPKTSVAPDDTSPSLPKTLPYAVLLKLTYEIQKALWTSQLYQFLKSLNCSMSPHVNMVFGDSNHIETMLNWIIAAHVRLDPPLHNIMVLSIDQPLCDFLVSKKVPVTCIAVPPQSFLASAGPQSYDQGIKTRLLVLRLINFGFERGQVGLGSALGVFYFVLVLIIAFLQRRLLKEERTVDAS